MQANEIIELARKHATNGATMASSAQLALADADALMADGWQSAAKARAKTSLRYSVGIFHADYKAAVAE